MPDHRGTDDSAKVLNWVGRLRPVWAAEVIAIVLAEKRADTLGTKISHAVVAIPRQDNRVGENDLVLVDAALEIA